jgi:hypothetical protein
MITILPETRDDLVAISVSQKLTAKDFDLYRALIKERIEKFGFARVYFEMREFYGWEAGSFFENAVFDIVNGSKFGKVAMVGDKIWQELAARLAGLVKKEGIKYFDLRQKELALRWINERKQ